MTFVCVFVCACVGATKHNANITITLALNCNDLHMVPTFIPLVVNSLYQPTNQPIIWRYNSYRELLRAAHRKQRDEAQCWGCTHARHITRPQMWCARSSGGQRWIWFVIIVVRAYADDVLFTIHRIGLCTRAINIIMICIFDNLAARFKIIFSTHIV